MSPPPPDDPGFTPYRDGARDESRFFDVFDAEVFHGQWFDERGRLTDFCFELRIENDGVMDVVTRIDCCHQEAHIHRFDASGGSTRKVIRPITTQEDVERAYKQAETLFYDQWEVNLMRWERGL